MDPSNVFYPQEIVNQGTNFMRYIVWIVASVVFLILFVTIWYCRNRIKDYKAMTMVILLLIALPLGIKLALEKTNLHSYALSKVIIEDVEISFDKQVILTTKNPSQAVILVGQEVIFPVNGTSVKTHHVFQLHPSTAEFSFLINGIRYDKW